MPMYQMHHCQISRRGMNADGASISRFVMQAIGSCLMSIAELAYTQRPLLMLLGNVNARHLPPLINTAKPCEHHRFIPHILPNLEFEHYADDKVFYRDRSGLVHINQSKGSFDVQA